MAKNPEELAHQEWLGYVQPVGLVVSIPALLDARAHINRNFGPDHRRFLEALPPDKFGEPVPEIGDFPAFAKAVFGWTTEDLCGAPGGAELPTSLEVALTEYNEALRPTYALREFQPADAAREWIMLIQELPKGANFDEIAVTDSRQWHASPQTRFERLLRQTRVPIGLLVNGTQIRLVFAPEKELSGHVTFDLADMVTVSGRPIFAALNMLLCSERLYSVAENERLPTILANSRKYQNVVSTKLAEQVLQALYELLRGFQAADDRARGELLREILARDPDHVYHGLLTVLLRLVFVLFAEDRGLLSTDPLYVKHYSVTGLYDRLREDSGRYADLMDQRFGAWAQLLVLFRLIYSGGSHGGMRIPPREGYLFDSDRYLFLEGRRTSKRSPVIPQVSDGVVFRVLSKLLLLDGERLSYRTLAVEQIGSVYQAIMGFSLHVAKGRSIAIKPAKKQGAPATINLGALLSTPPDKRAKRLRDETDQELKGQSAEGLKSAQTVEELLVALNRKIDTAVTPLPVPDGAMIFQPSDERRKSGSHYTPTSLTRPIVEAALEPVLKQLGPNPTPAQILNLKVCDLAMGSAAFLVEACRQLGDALTKAWHAHNEVPSIPPDEDEALYAQRLIAQRCLYGLDKNPMAADLAKLSLWLATLAKDHPFTFLDHSLRHGDALVGLTRKQIASFNWAPSAQQSFLEDEIRKRITRATQYRQRILDARDSVSYAQLEQELRNADDALNLPRMVGDAGIAAFFSADKPKQREEKRRELQALVEADLKKQGFITVEGEVDCAVHLLHKAPKGLAPFHWELEFPEVFTMDSDGVLIGGFDAVLGNPPFMAGKRVSTALGDSYRDWLVTIYDEANSNADLVALFYRRAFDLLRQDGCFGLIATNTISQGDTRSTGLRWICGHGGTIYRARKRLKWPGEAAVIVSVVHVKKGGLTGPYLLDRRSVPIITAYLFHAGGSDDPAKLKANEDKSYIGSFVHGMGFTFDDDDTAGVASTLAEMHRLINKDPRNAECIFPFIGGEEVNNSPTHTHHRYIIDFFDMSLEEAARWPDLLEIVRLRVKPERDGQKRAAVRERWWQYADKRPGLYRATRNLNRVLAISCAATPHMGFAFLPSGMVFAHSLALIATEEDAIFAMVQSRVHEVWVRFFASSMKDDLRYTPSDCYETFPLPTVHDNSVLSELGSKYYQRRAEIMQRHNIGLTKLYNCFNAPSPEIAEIAELRELHASVDRAVLDTYGWTDIQLKCEFISEFDDEDEEDENGRAHQKKYRYRWPDEIRDEVLARLLELNRQRALEEGQLLSDGAESPQPKNKGRKKKAAAQSAAESTQPLFAVEKGDD